MKLENTVKMPRLLKYVTIIALMFLNLLLGTLAATGNIAKIPFKEFKHKGLSTMLRHRPWYSGKREKPFLNNEVGRQTIKTSQCSRMEVRPISYTFLVCDVVAKCYTDR